MSPFFANFGQDPPWQFDLTIIDMKARTISLAQGRVIKTIFEPIKG